MVNKEKVMFVRQRLQNGASIEKVRADLVASKMPAQEIENTLQNAISSLSPDTEIAPAKHRSFKSLGVIFFLLIVGSGLLYGYGVYTGKASFDSVIASIGKTVSFVVELVKSIFSN
ncbi:MAG TPA: hypothetical protein VEC13_03260 [Candidatus Paceibacterota bacterium]|nr:hypothetical protein [Candidatus Paceibacterota bacterium]